MEGLAGGSRGEDGDADHGGHRGGRHDAGQRETAGLRPARTPLRVDARAQPRRRLDLLGGALKKGKRTLLLPEPLRELGRRLDLISSSARRSLETESSASAASSTSSSAPASSSRRRFIGTSPRTVTVHVPDDTGRAGFIPRE